MASPSAGAGGHTRRSALNRSKNGTWPAAGPGGTKAREGARPGSPDPPGQAARGGVVCDPPPTEKLAFVLTSRSPRAMLRGPGGMFFISWCLPLHLSCFFPHGGSGVPGVYLRKGRCPHWQHPENSQSSARAVPGKAAFTGRLSSAGYWPPPSEAGGWPAPAPAHLCHGSRADAGCSWSFP